MPLQLNVGVSRKVGLPEYSSVGASCHVEVELDSSLLDDPDGFQARVRGAYSACHRAVAEELDRLRTGEGDPGTIAPSPSKNGHAGRGVAPTSRNGAPKSAPDRRNDASRTRKPASAAQVRALHAIANRHGIDLAGVLLDRFQMDSPEALTSTAASRLIDELQHSADHALA